MNDLVTSLLLLSVGLAVGEAAERSDRFQVRMKRTRHLRRFDRVTSLAVSGVEDERDLMIAVTAESIDALRLGHCSFEWPPFVDELPHLRSDGTVGGSTARWTGGDVELPTTGVDLRVIGRGHTIGRFILVPSPRTRASAERLPWPSLRNWAWRWPRRVS